MANQAKVDIGNKRITIEDKDRYSYVLTEWKIEPQTKIKENKVTSVATGILEDKYIISPYKERIFI